MIETVPALVSASMDALDLRSIKRWYYFWLPCVIKILVDSLLFGLSISRESINGSSGVATVPLSRVYEVGSSSYFFLVLFRDATLLELDCADIVEFKRLKRVHERATRRVVVARHIQPDVANSIGLVISPITSTAQL